MHVKTNFSLKNSCSQLKIQNTNQHLIFLQAKHDINVCLDTLACMSQQSSATKSCSQLEIQCVIEIPPKFIDTEAYFHSNSIGARISQLECKIEALLCQLPARQPRRSRQRYE